MRRFTVLAGVVMLAPALALGAGFSLYEHGARAVALGGAFAATADDPTAVYYNPAGLAFLEGTSVTAGAYGISYDSKIYGDNPYPGRGYTEEMESRIFIPPHAYATGKVGERAGWGIGVYAPFGLGTQWPDSWAGRYITRRIDLEVYNVNPNFAYRLADNFAVAVGADFFLVDLDLWRAAGVVNPYSQVMTDVANVNLAASNEHAWGWNAALLWKLSGGFSLGLSYRSRVELEAEGTGRFIQVPTGHQDFDAIVSGMLPFNTTPRVTSEITFPAETRFGLAWRDERVGVEVNWVRIGWSSFDEFPMVFPDYPHLTQIRPENYEDSDTYRLGFEFKSSEKLSWQLGALYDETPVPVESVSPLLPDASRRGVSVGLSYQLAESLRLDASFLHLMFLDRSTKGRDLDNFNGTYKSRAELLGFSLIYTF